MKNILVASLALVASASVASAQVRLGTEGAYMPWNGLDENNEVIGFEREVGDRLCEIAGLTCEWVINDWDSIIPNLVAGNYDAIIAGMSITAERDEVIDFTAEYYPPSPSLYMALSGGAASGVIAAQTNTIQAGYVADMGGDLIEFATPDERAAVCSAKLTRFWPTATTCCRSLKKRAVSSQSLAIRSTSAAALAWVSVKPTAT